MISPVSSAKSRWSGNFDLITSIIAFSAAWSASVTKLLTPSLLEILKSPLKKRTISAAPAFAASINVGLSMGKDNKPLNPLKGNKKFLNAVRELLFLKKSLNSPLGAGACNYPSLLSIIM